MFVSPFRQRAEGDCCARSQVTAQPLRLGSSLARITAVVGIVGVALLSLAIHTPRASAHAYFLASAPAPGKRVERSPRRVKLEFTEPLNHSLSKATIVNLATSKAVRSKVLPAPSRELILKPVAPLSTAAYRVDWFSVSTDDGHALAGQFSFGVRTKAVGGTHSVEEGPLSRGGWWRIALRALFYAALFFFAGGLFNAALLSGRQGRGRWLVPSSRLRTAIQARGLDPQFIGDRAWLRTVDVGWLAAASATLLALADAANAAGGLSLNGLHDYLLTNTAGVGRISTVVALALAALLAWRAPRVAAVACALAFGAIAFSGHANSADPHAVALLSDWVHLLAAAVWIGGIAQLAVTWSGPLIRERGELGSIVMGEVLDRFGRVALPAFLVVVISGLLNALIELGHPAELWQSAYGRVLAVKMGLVAAAAAISYLHALRLRPLLQVANPHPDPKLERHHWRLLRREPLVGLGVLAVAALLVAFPLPPRQLSSAAEAQSLLACRPSCPLPPAKDNQLQVADHLGPAIVAAWLQRGDSGLSGRVRLLGDSLKPVAAAATIASAQTQDCGPGCWTFELGGHPTSIAVRATIEGHTYAARLPARWIAGQRANQRARQLLATSQETMNGLKSAREYERITSGPGSLALTHYELRAPDRFAYRTQLGGASVVIGKREWDRTTAHTRWQLSHYGGGGPPFITQTWFRWTPYAQAVRLLSIRPHGPRPVAEIALYDQAAPTWWRLRIDLPSKRAMSSRLIAEAHFMTQRYFDFNRPLLISPPTANRGG
jgi:copper transport protein